MRSAASGAILGHCFVGRNKTCEFIAADASADTARLPMNPAELSDKADGEVPSSCPYLSLMILNEIRIDGKQDVLRK